MGIINRILLFFFSLSVAALSLVVLAACLGVLPESVWLNELQYALTRPEDNRRRCCRLPHRFPAVLLLVPPDASRGACNGGIPRAAE